MYTPTHTLAKSQCNKVAHVVFGFATKIGEESTLKFVSFCCMDDYALCMDGQLHIVCMFMYIYMYIYIYVYMHTYVHIIHAHTPTYTNMIEFICVRVFVYFFHL